MSSDQPSDARSSGPEITTEASPSGLSGLVRERGAPLLEALEQRLPGSREHVEATASYALATAAGLRLPRYRCEAIRETARLHDVGRLYIPVDLLAKPTPELTPDERETLDREAEWGYQLALGAGIPETACRWIRFVPERFDGRGPAGLAGDGIELESRVIRAACTCDHLLAAPTASQIPAFERRRLAIGTLRAKAGTELDPAAVEALANVLLTAGD